MLDHSTLLTARHWSCEMSGAERGIIQNKMAPNLLQCSPVGGGRSAPACHQPLILQRHLLWRDIMPDGEACTSVLNSILCKLVSLAGKRRSEVC